MIIMDYLLHHGLLHYGLGMTLYHHLHGGIVTVTFCTT